MNEIYTPELPNSNPQARIPLHACWSPARLFRKTECALGIVTNTGNVEIFICIADTWIRMINLTEILVNSFKDNWNEMNSSTSNLEDKYTIHKKRVKQCAATCKYYLPQIKL